jgi:hypothetical protein
MGVVYISAYGIENTVIDPACGGWFCGGQRLLYAGGNATAWIFAT